MPQFNPRDLADWADGVWRNGVPRAVDGFGHDSRTIRPGALFVALTSGERDGHAFLDHARSRGASGAVVDRYVESSPLPQLVTSDALTALQRMAARHRERFTGPVIGVTGSCGKTSTKDLLAELLAGRGPVVKTEGNLNNHIGVPLTLLTLDPGRHGIAVIEAGINRPGEMALLADLIRPTHGIVTNVAPVHLERLENLDTIAREKAILLRAVPSEGIAVFPAMCRAFPAFRDLKASVRLLDGDPETASAGRTLLRRFLPADPAAFPDGGAARATCRAESDGKGGRLRIRLPGQTEEAVFPVRPLSAGMAENAGLAVVLAHALGTGDDGIRDGLARWRPGAFRGETFSTADCFYYMDCYNSSPVALVDALEAFGQAAPAGMPRLYVIGSMAELGVEADRFHRETLRFLELGPGDRACLIGDHAHAMGEGLAAAGNSPERWAVYEDAGAVREDLRDFRGAVFIKGSRRYRLESLGDAVRDRRPCGEEVAC